MTVNVVKIKNFVKYLTELGFSVFTRPPIQ